MPPHHHLRELGQLHCQVSVFTGGAVVVLAAGLAIGKFTTRVSTVAVIYTQADTLIDGKRTALRLTVTLTSGTILVFLA